MTEMRNIQYCKSDASRQCLQTETLLNDVLLEDNQSPFLKFLLHAMKDMGCNVQPAIHFVIEKCDSFNGYGGFDSSNNEIVLCQEKFSILRGAKGRRQMDAVLTHELIHAFDHCRADIDFYDDPTHSMCSEIRAAALSGQCTMERKAGSALFGGIKNCHQKCVKMQAISSFKALHPSWTRKDSATLLDKVFPMCYHDTEPFDRIPMSLEDASRSYKAYTSRNRYAV